MQSLTDQEGRIAMWDGRFPGLASKQAKCATAGGDDARRTSKFGRDLFYWFASDIAPGKLDVFFPVPDDPVHWVINNTQSGYQSLRSTITIIN